MVGLPQLGMDLTQRRGDGAGIGVFVFLFDPTRRFGGEEYFGERRWEEDTFSNAPGFDLDLEDQLMLE